MSHEWENSLCGCFSACGTCCLTYWCPCVTYSRTGYRLQHRNDPDANDHSFCSGSCWIYCAMLSLTGGLGNCVLQIMRRGDMRRQLDIKGNGCTDCLTATCCAFCELVQEDREAEDWQKGKGLYAMAQPAKQDPMMYQPQNYQPQPYQQQM